MKVSVVVLFLLFIFAIILIIITRSCLQTDENVSDHFDPLNQERPVIWFHHIHKAGGTSFVKLAEANGEKLYYQGEPRNGLPTNRYGYFIPFGKMSKQEQTDFVKDAHRNGTTFIATEFDFPKPEEKYQGTTDVIILRDPVDRLISHLAHLLREPEDPRKDFNQRNPETTIRQNTKYFANVVTKVLSGHSFDYDGEINEGDYQKALKNLKNFDTILILEDPQSYLKMQKHGWKNFRMPTENVSSKRDFQTNVGVNTSDQTKKILRQWMGPDYLQKLRQIGKYDQKLYEFAANESYKGYR